MDKLLFSYSILFLGAFRKSPLKLGEFNGDFIVFQLDELVSPFNVYDGLMTRTVEEV